MPKVAEDQQGSNRVQLIHNRTLPLPGKCAICGYAGAGTDGQPRRSFLDIGLDVDYYGAVIFCEQCVVDLVLPLGFHAPEAYDAIVAKLQHATLMLSRMQNDNTHLRAIVSSGASLTPNSESNAVVSAESNSDPAQTELALDEPTSDEGPTSVSSGVNNVLAGFGLS
jgi:hypothetical protein